MDFASNVIGAKGWESVLQEMECLCKLKWFLNHLTSGVRTLLELIDAQSKKNKYIIMCINYLGKCTETKEIKVATEERVVEFFKENVFHKFGYPRELVSDQGILPPTQLKTC